PLDLDGVNHYVRHRLNVAGHRGGSLFDARALKRIFRASRGTPRLVNILCHKSLMAAYGRGADRVTARHADLAVRDTEGVHGRRLLRWPFMVGAPLAAVALMSAWFAGVLLP